MKIDEVFTEFNYIVGVVFGFLFFPIVATLNFFGIIALTQYETLILLAGIFLSYYLIRTYKLEKKISCYEFNKKYSIEGGK